MVEGRLVTWERIVKHCPRAAIYTAVLVVLFSYGSLELTPAARAQGVHDVAEAEQLLVMIAGELGGRETWGAGIIVGKDQDALTIITAGHVVRRGDLKAERLTVQLKAAQGRPIAATILPHSDAQLDIALLRVERLREHGVDIDRVAFDRLAEPATLRPGDPVYSLGYPRRRPWDINAKPDHFTARRETRLYYQSNILVPGHSGGALLTRDGELVGMILSDQAPDGEAVAITEVLAKVAAWNYPVGLRNRFAQTVPILLSSGSGFTCQIVDGVAYCWGSNNEGQLGSGIASDSARPVRVRERIDFRSIGTGSRHACAITTSGSAYCWGDNSSGQLGDGSTTSRRVPIAVAGGLIFVAVHGGWDHTCAVTPDGEAYCWGENEDGQLGNGSRINSAVPLRVAGNVRWRAVSAGIGYTCGVAYGGNAYCWGSNHFGHLGNSSKIPSAEPVPVAGGLSFSSISAGNLHTCGITTQGRAYCWGNNKTGELGNGTKQASAEPMPVAGDLSFASIVSSKPSGKSFTCGVTVKGAAYCWGFPSEWLGSRDVQHNAKPLRVETDVMFAAISSGFSHSCGRTRDGTVYCWGSNRSGQLSDAASGDTWRPVAVQLDR